MIKSNQPPRNPGRIRPQHISLNINIPKGTVYSLFCLFYISLSLIRFTWPDRIVNSIVIALIGLSALLIYLVDRELDRRLKLISLSFILMLLVAFYLSGFLNSHFDRMVQTTLFILSSSGIALLLTTGLVSAWSIKIPFWSLSCYFLILMFLAVDPMEAIFTSQNGISQMILFACISFYLIGDGSNRELDLKPAFVTFIICLWGVGRSGIVASFVLLFLLVYYKFDNRLVRTSLLIVLILIVSFLSIPYYGSDEQIKTFYGYFNDTIFSNTISNYSKTFDVSYNTRQEILYYYFLNFDLFQLFFGVDPREKYWPDGELLDYNYHNSFLTLHSQVGLFGLIYVILLCCSVFLFKKRNIIFSVLILTLFIRWSTDSYLFFEFFDYIPLFFVFTLFQIPRRLRWPNSVRRVHGKDN